MSELHRIQCNNLLRFVMIYKAALMHKRYSDYQKSRKKGCLLPFINLKSKKTRKRLFVVRGLTSRKQFIKTAAVLVQDFIRQIIPIFLWVMPNGQVESNGKKLAILPMNPTSNEMRNCLVQSKTVYELEVSDDYLQTFLVLD